MPACWMAPAVPPMALMRPALTLVGVTFDIRRGPLRVIEDVGGGRLDAEHRSPRTVARAEPLVQPEVPEVQARRFNRAAGGCPEAADRRRAECADVEPPIDGRIGELRIAQLVGTDGYVGPGGGRRESGPGWIRHRDRRRQEVAGLQIADERQLPAADQEVDESRAPCRASASPARTAGRTSAAVVRRCSGVAESRPRSRARSNGSSIALVHSTVSVVSFAMV